MPSLRALAVATVLVVAGCSGGDGATPTQEVAPAESPQLVTASADLLRQCEATADEVGYAVPCPTRILSDLKPTGGTGWCQLAIIGPGGLGGCGKQWRAWVVGSSGTPDQHLVIVGSPALLRNDAKVVNGPGWYPGARVRLLERLTVNGWPMRAVYVPARTNAGSAFSKHVVLIWTVAGHTYGIGFHKVRGVRETLELDVALARGVQLVAPRAD